MIKTVSMLTATVLSIGLVTGCAVQADDEVGSTDTELEQDTATQALRDPFPRKTLYCGLEKSGAVAAQQTASAFYQYLTAGPLVGPGNTATAADRAAYSAAGGTGNLGATTFSKFYPPATMKGSGTTIAATNSAIATLKGMLDAGSLMLSDASPGTICGLAAGIRGVYGASGSSTTVTSLINSFSTNAVASGYPEGLPSFLTIPASGGTGSTSGGIGFPGTSGGPLGGGTSSGGIPPLMQPLFYVDPEPARMFENLTGSNGTTGLATYVNSGESTYGVRWTSLPQAGGVALGAACSTADITAGTEIYKAIQVMSDGKRRCK